MSDTFYYHHHYCHHHHNHNHDLHSHRYHHHHHRLHSRHHHHHHHHHCLHTVIRTFIIIMMMMVCHHHHNHHYHIVSSSSISINTRRYYTTAITAKPLCNPVRALRYARGRQYSQCNNLSHIRVTSLQKKLAMIEKREADETAALENMVQMVERNLELTTVSTIIAAQQAKQQFISLTQDKDVAIRWTASICNWTTMACVLATICNALWHLTSQWNVLHEFFSCTKEAS